MVSTGIYLRVSTDEQAKEGFSVRAQEEKLRSYAAAKDWNIFKVYADEGFAYGQKPKSLRVLNFKYIKALQVPNLRL